MIRIPTHIYDGIVTHAYSELPNEACGLLVGKESEVFLQYELTNIDHSPEHFSFDTAEHFQVFRSSRTEGLEIIANYHSHPETTARPSMEDIRLAYDVNILYLIVSLAAEIPVLKAFSIQNGIYSEVPIEVFDD